LTNLGKRFAHVGSLVSNASKLGPKPTRE